MFEVGDVVGSYTILAHLRSGGMADLFLARREGAMGFRRLVAVKVVHPRHAEDDHLVRMFLDEALISARIDHPNVVHVEDLGQLDDTYFLVMEYVHGCSLAQLMRVLGRMHRRLSPLVAVAIAARVAEGLHAAHETTDDGGELVNLVHRDVSPQNILLSHKGHVKLIDFGVAKAEMRSEKTNVAMLKGKVRYMPPEQATTGIVDRRSDIYSLGIVLWEMLTMRRLFAGKTEFEVLLKVRKPVVEPPSKYVSDIPRELDEVVLSALAVDPDQRPKTAKSFRRMLARALPRSMSLDSAHLADLMLSIVGDELEEVRHELPQEISRLLEAEQLRVALAEREARVGDEETTESAVDVMTLHSQVVAFEEDELDRSPEGAAIPFKPSSEPPSAETASDVTETTSDSGLQEALTKVGRPARGDATRPTVGERPAVKVVVPRPRRAEAPPPSDPPAPELAPAQKAPRAASVPSAPAIPATPSQELGVMASSDLEAANAEREEDAEPTLVGEVPEDVVKAVKRKRAIRVVDDTRSEPPPPPSPSPAATPAITVPEPGPPSHMAVEAAPRRVRPPPAVAWIAAVMASVILGVLLALLWPSSDEPEEPGDRAPAQVDSNPGGR
ncbi:MAG: serine/threonine protein kinase [Sandaracinaceae bacterium]|nr:serine/threonine protein kinase [Sandaracinaceae bacterium]